MTGGRRRATAARDDGFTLIELVVASAVILVILLAVGGLMVSTTLAQRTVTAVSLSASSAQTAADAIRVQLRNAVEVRPPAVVDGHDQLLVARVASTGATASYECRAWYFASDERELRTTTWPVAGSTALPTGPESVASWALLLTGVSPRSGDTIFGEPFGTTIEVSFLVDSDDRNAPTAIEFTAQQGGSGGGTTCWD